MPVEFGIWRIDQGVEQIELSSLELESRLEDILEEDISIAAPNWMVIGRQVKTDHGGSIDLLAIDRDGNIVVIELKRAKTPRDIVAQVLDYGSWVRALDDVAIARIWTDYAHSHSKASPDVAIDAAFCEHFGVNTMPSELNQSHDLVIVATSLDVSTERIVGYLADEYGVRVNALFFRAFRDGDREYLARAWLREPAASPGVGETKATKREWNGEFYVSFGGNPNRSWDEAVKYGFVPAGGGSWYTNTLKTLSPGDRIWVNVPGPTGYVGVGVVEAEAVPIDDFTVRDENGTEVPLVSLDTKAAKLTRFSEDPEHAEWLVRVKWLKTVPVSQAVQEKGFFGNQNTVARPVDPSWEFTISRLKERFGVT